MMVLASGLPLGMSFRLLLFLAMLWNLRVYTKDVLHLDSTTTSRDEGMIKRDLEVSTNDFLTSLRSMERTLTHQHWKVIDGIEQEKVSISVSHRILLFREVIGNISSTALAKALEPCTGLIK